MSHCQPTVCASQRPYGRLSLVELAERVAGDADSHALSEFHGHRTPFRMQGGPRLSLVSFLDAVCGTSYARRLVNGSQMLLERAYDLTVDKFSNLPSLAEEGAELKSKEPPRSRKRSGPRSAFRTTSCGSSGTRAWRPSEARTRQGAGTPGR